MAPLQHPLFRKGVLLGSKPSFYTTAEQGHTQIPSCQLGQCSDQIESDWVNGTG